MKKYEFGFLKATGLVMVLSLCLFGSNVVSAKTAHHWEYEGEAGPDHWADLDAEFSTCAKGKHQSPINILKTTKSQLSKINFDYLTGKNKLEGVFINNGHTVEFQPLGTYSMNIDGNQFVLKQFHFHRPSENLIHGKSFPVEAHFVHVDSQGNLAVLAVMIEQGKNNALMEQLVSFLPKQKDQKNQVLLENASLQSFFPKDASYYRFDGSLTTPPCSEGVAWFVLKQPMNMSKAQIQAISAAIGHDNHRPVQAVNNRLVLE